MVCFDRLVFERTNRRGDPDGSRRSARRRGITGFVAARAVSRRREGSLVILPLTAALAICVFAAGVYAAASTWRASAAATEVGADYAYTSPAGLPETVALTHEIDPEGQYLMAAGVLDVGDVGEKLILDAPRLGRVGVWPASWTPGMDGEAVSRALSTTRPALTLSGARFELAVDNQVTSNVGELGVALSLETAAREQRTVFFGPFPGGTSTAASAAPFCRNGCLVEKMSFGGPAAASARMTGSVTIRSLSVDGSAGDEAFVDPDAWAVTLGGVEDIRAPRVVAALDVSGLSLLAGLVVVLLVVVVTYVSALSVQRSQASTLRESTG